MALFKRKRESQSDQDYTGDFVSVPGVSALLGLGFEPMERFPPTLSECFSFWPEQDRASVTERRPHWLPFTGGPGEVLLVRSPWPDLPLVHLFRAVWSVATTHPDWETNPLRTREAASHVLNLPHEELRQLCQTAPSYFGTDDE